MFSSINNNLMAQNTARTLNSHYARLSTSVARLSSGLRINSSADDAAGLAIRELMRADVAALNQGARNANDAISMLQVADAALAIIDEKLIRMKELAEQAATGTYSSTQRLMIQSEYQAMADEIDRIARATDFNGIHLLDGSLSGAHNGTGLESKGAMKIHFGSANDSAEDYYYVEIGACTSAALGLGAGQIEIPPTVTWIQQETVGEVTQTFRPQREYEEYMLPNGRKCYKDGDYFFLSLDNPIGTRITDQTVIDRIYAEQDTVKTNFRYKAYLDPVTNTEYYQYFEQGYYYTSDPYDPTGKGLDREKPEDKAIIDRLQQAPGNKEIDVAIVWRVYRDEDGNKFYSYNNGNTFVPNPSLPGADILDSANPDDKAYIDTFEIMPGVTNIDLPTAKFTCDTYTIPGSNTYFYSMDGGKTFFRNTSYPYETMLDPVKDKNTIARLELWLNNATSNKLYEIWRTPDTRTAYLTADGGLTFIDLNGHPLDIVLRRDDPADSLIIATLSPNPTYTNITHRCDVYEDSANGNKQYYSWDKGQSYFDDIGDPFGSLVDMTDPANAGYDANFQKVDSSITISTRFVQYQDPQTSAIYYSSDGGLSFYINPAKSNDKMEDAQIIGRLRIKALQSHSQYRFFQYRDPVTGNLYYSYDGSKNYFITDVNNPGNIVLDYSKDQAVIDRLEPVKDTTTAHAKVPLPTEFEIYKAPGSTLTYYTSDGGQTFTTRPFNPYSPTFQLDPVKDKDLLASLQPVKITGTKIELIEQITPGYTMSVSGGISTQEQAQGALVAIDRAIASKDTIRAHLGAMQNRLENTVTNLTIQAENLQSAESRISDTDVALEMTQFVRNQILTQSAVAMLGQANSFPHMLMTLLG